jgi:Dyp-type peroxidase family
MAVAILGERHVSELERSDMQGILMSAYAHLPCAAYMLLRVTEPRNARTWLRAVAGEVTTGAGKEEQSSVNVALTHPGLEALGLDRRALATFPLAFQEGMASEKRSRVLGDTDDSAPAAWRWGNGSTPVHVLLMLFARDEKILSSLLDAQKRAAAASNGVAEAMTLSAGRQPDTREHFGFDDGTGQPVIAGSGRKMRQLRRTGHATEVQPGEFVLGYVNEYGVPAETPLVDATRDPQRVLRDVDLPADLLFARQGSSSGWRDLGRNGSYLVFRQLSQDVARFWQFVDTATRNGDGTSDADARVRLAAKMVGRWPSGAPLVKSPDRDDPSLKHENNFGYADTDKHGFACPVGAHIRRCNTRDSLGDDPDKARAAANRHRLLRRGRSYGDRIADPLRDDGQERGLHFICLNADIERQFEFVQQTWINNPMFGGLNGEVDPLMGTQHGRGIHTIPEDPLRTRIHGVPRFVHVKGGAYFFLPGMAALRYLASPEA